MLYIMHLKCIIYYQSYHRAESHNAPTLHDVWAWRTVVYYMEPPNVPYEPHYKKVKFKNPSLGNSRYIFTKLPRLAALPLHTKKFQPFHWLAAKQSRLCALPWYVLLLLLYWTLQWVVFSTMQYYCTQRRVCCWQMVDQDWVVCRLLCTIRTDGTIGTSEK